MFEQGDFDEGEGRISPEKQKPQRLDDKVKQIFVKMGGSKTMMLDIASRGMN